MNYHYTELDIGLGESYREATKVSGLGSHSGVMRGKGRWRTIQGSLPSGLVSEHPLWGGVASS